MNRSIVPIIVIASILAVVPTAVIAAGNGKTSATFQATASGEISGGPQAAANGITSSTTQVTIRLMPLDLSLLRATTEAGDSCFWQGAYEGPLTINRDRSGAAIAQYFFTARTKDGVTDVKYLLDLQGAFVDASNWLPAVGTSATMHVDSWKVAAEAKGQGRAACGGNGSVSDTLIVIERLK